MPRSCGNAVGHVTGEGITHSFVCLLPKRHNTSTIIHLHRVGTARCSNERANNADRINHACGNAGDVGQVRDLAYRLNIGGVSTLLCNIDANHAVLA